MPSRAQILTAKQPMKKSIPRSQVVRIIDGDDELKNIAGQVLTNNSKNFHWLNKKLELERTMNELGKPFRAKQSDPKNQKNSKKIKVKLPHANKKTTSDRANFCSNTVFSLYFKIRAKKNYAAKQLAFSLHFLFRRDQNH